MYKIGDRVRIKDCDYCVENCNYFSAYNMGKYCNKTAIITSIGIEENGLDYDTPAITLNISEDESANDGRGWLWEENALEKIAAKSMEIE